MWTLIRCCIMSHLIWVSIVNQVTLTGISSGQWVGKLMYNSQMCLIYYYYYDGRINLKKKCFIIDFQGKNISSVLLNLEILALSEISMCTILYIYIFHE